MTYNHPAYKILDELNTHYETTRDPDTAQKIISLVDSQLRHELDRNRHCDGVHDAESGTNSGVFHEICSLFSLRKNSESSKHEKKDPFTIYRTLVQERNQKRENHYYEKLQSQFGVGATLSGEDMVRVMDHEKRYEELHRYLQHSLAMICRNLSLHKHSYHHLIKNNTLMLDADALSQITSMEHAVSRVAQEIKQILDSNSGYHRHFDSGGYTDHLLTIDEKYNLNDIFKSWADEYTPFDPQTLTVLKSIGIERMRQINSEGYSKEHDDEHTDGSIANAAAHYICADENINLWTWDKNFDKKEKHDRDKQLLIGATMAVAEIERRNRLDKTTTSPTKSDDEVDQGTKAS